MTVSLEIKIGFSFYATMACLASNSTCMDGEVECQTIESPNNETLQILQKHLQFSKTLIGVNEETKESDDQAIGSINIGTTEFVEPKNNRFSNVESRDRRAAVLICLFKGHEGELRVVLTKRSMKLSSYPGQVALPGGKMDEGDVDDSATALREAMEEIGLDPGQVQVVANLEPFISMHLLTVVPVVGLLARIEDFEPLLNTDEVDAVFHVPLEMFLKEDCHRCEEMEWSGLKYTSHLFDYESDEGAFLIWGLTASILIRAATVIYRRSPSFTGNLPDFQQLQKALNTNVPS